MRVTIEVDDVILQPLKEELMALSQQVSDGLNNLATGVNEVRSSVEALRTAVVTRQQSLQDRIMELEAVRDALVSEDATEDAAHATQVEDLNNIIASLRSDEAEVMAALQTAADSLTGTDAAVDEIRTAQETEGVEEDVVVEEPVTGQPTPVQENPDEVVGGEPIVDVQPAGDNAVTIGPGEAPE